MRRSLKSCVACRSTTTSTSRRAAFTPHGTTLKTKPVLRGVEHLGNAGVPLSSILVYMLVGWDETETFERIEERHDKLVHLGLMPFPMVFEQTPRVTRNGIPWLELKKFQRWAIRSAKFGIPWQDYRAGARPDAMKGQPRLFTWPSLRHVA